MPVTAAIKFTQGVTTDSPGRALIGTVAVAVAISNGDNTDVFDWTWELLTKPSASAIPSGIIAAGAVSSASFTPDVAGSYLARLTVKDTAGNQAQDIRAFIVLEGSGRLIPPFRGDFSSLNYGGQVEGWDPAMERWLHSIDGKAPRVNASSGALNNIVSLDLVDSTVVEGLRFSNVLGATINGIASGYGGRRLYVLAAAAAVVFANQNAGSLAANRIVTGTGADVTLQLGSSAWLVYDGVDLRWRLQPITTSVGSASAVIFDDAVPADQVNIRSDRATNQSPIDNTKVGITNLGSDNAATAGAIADYATIGGGLNNEVSGIGAVVIGGTGNVAAGADSMAGGNGSGVANTGTGAIAFGTNCGAAGIASCAIGNLSNANGDYSTALGYAADASRYGQYAHNGNGGATGEQFGRIQLRGLSGNGVLVPLQLGDFTDFQLEDGKTYAMRITFMGSRTDAQGSASEVHQVLVHATGGVAVIDDDTPVAVQANGEAWTWTLTTPGGLTLGVDFAGTLAQTVRGIALFEWVETDGF